MHARARTWTVAVCLAASAVAAGCGGGDDDEPEPDPVAVTTGIEGVVVTPLESLAAGHVKREQQVAYASLPPVGGAHDQIWADCNGVVYNRPVRTENMVHSMEHGAVWIAYDPARVDAAGMTALTQLVEGEQYLMLSPVPGMTAPISVQSWGRQLQLDTATDPRLPRFIERFRLNEDSTPELGATCDVPDRYRELFDQDNPPAFDPTPGPDAVSPDFKGGR